MDARCAVEQAARDSYGRLVAFLAARSRDVAAAEDALAELLKPRSKPGRSAACRKSPKRGC